MKINILNCNCIRESEINIEERTLNIKYGPNGTGKSTLSRAICLEASGNEEGLQELKPYTAGEENKPEVKGLSFDHVWVFDERYVNSYLFKEESLFENSFRVFLRSEECNNLANEISELLAELQGMFQENEILQKLRNFLPKLPKVMQYSGGNISRRGGVGEFFKGNGAGFEKHAKLKAYEPFYKRNPASVLGWANWRTQGIGHMQDATTCPFCTEGLKKEIYEQNEIIKQVFKGSALKTANEVLSYIQEGVASGYISNDAIDSIREYISNVGMEDSLFAEMSSLVTETDYLNNKIERICSFRPMNVTQEQLQDLETSLNELYIDKRQIGKFYSTEFVYEFVDEIEAKIKNLKGSTGKLRGLFVQHEKKLMELISARKEDINTFFLLAGFPYSFEIKLVGENNAVSYLVPVDCADTKVANLGTHLSWGEKNAFALVMFMFEAVSSDADLIVLDDPITSFDKDKKFAVIRRMFDNKKISFRDRTVIMLTHDLQPLIDYVHNDLFKRMGLTTPVKAALLQNENGTLFEYEITGSSMINAVKMSEEMARNKEKSMIVRVVNLRKYVEMTKPNFAETSTYEVLSNVIHGRPVAQKGDGKTNLEENVLNEGMKEIESYLGVGDYSELVDMLSVKSLLEAAGSAGSYEKILAIRLLFERIDGLLMKLRKKYPAACKFVNETNHVENDYIFQLDPLRYFQIPQIYLSEIESFLSENRDEIVRAANK